MNGKTGFAVVAVVVLMAASMVPVVGSQQKSMSANRNEPPVAEGKTHTDTKMVEVPVQIHLRDGVKEVTRELPVETVTTLYSMFNRTRRAVKTLQASHALPEEKQRADEVIDTFLHTLKSHGLLGDVSVARVKSLVTGGYRKAHDHARGQRLPGMAHLFEQNGWRTNAMCSLHAWGAVMGLFPYNFPLYAAMVLLANLFE